MWAAIFRQPEIREYPKLRKCMLQTLNYEALYHEVLESYTGDEVRCLTKAILNAYQEMHELICESDLKRSRNAAAVCRAFITQFDGSGHERGFFSLLIKICFWSGSFRWDICKGLLLRFLPL